MTLVTDTRAALREALLADLEQAIDERSQTLESGPLEGLVVISAGHVDEVFAEARQADLPELDDTTAEVRTPATVFVLAECPRCHIGQTISVEMEPQLVVSRDGSELKLKARAKSRTHVCGQLPLPVGAADGQGSFELEDITRTPFDADGRVGNPVEETDTPLDLGRCPYPGCDLVAEHGGAHGAVEDDEDVDDDLLPGEPSESDGA